jgi:hypothetical protein
MGAQRASECMKILWYKGMDDSRLMYFLSSPRLHDDDRWKDGLVHTRPSFFGRIRDIHDEKTCGVNNEMCWNTLLGLICQSPGDVFELRQFEAWRTFEDAFVCEQINGLLPIPYDRLTFSKASTQRSRCTSLCAQCKTLVVGIR